TNSTPLDLELHLSPEGDGYAGAFTYNTDLFDQETIARLAGHYQTLLSALLNQPDRNVFEVPLLTAAERHQLVVQWNETQVDYPAGEMTHQLIEAQANRTPNAVAVTFGTESLTYRQLVGRASQLANHLRDLGLERETRVAICVDRSQRGSPV